MQMMQFGERGPKDASVKTNQDCCAYTQPVAKEANRNTPSDQE